MAFVNKNTDEILKSILRCTTKFSGYQPEVPEHREVGTIISAVRYCDFRG